MLSPNKLYINSIVTLRLNIQSEAEADVDPTTVLIRVMSPSGVETSYTYGDDDEVTKTSVGDYEAAITPDEAGRWFYRWETTGSVSAVEDNFLVQDSPFYQTWPTWDYMP